MGWKRKLGFSAMMGNRRDLDEAEEEREEILIAIRDKHRDWKEMEACLPEVERRITILREKVRKEG